MKIFRFSCIFLAASALLAACSVYESSGRKSLENNAFAIANGQISFDGCGKTASAANKSLLSEDNQVRVFQFDSDPTRLQIDRKDATELVCQYQFVSLEAVKIHLQDAIHHALDQRTVER